MSFRIRLAFAVIFVALLAPVLATPALGDDEPAATEIRAGAAATVAAFNAGKADDMASVFAPKGELIDEEGNVYQGRKELADGFTKFFQKFPGAQLRLDIESIRQFGPDLAIEEGTRYITAPSKEKGAVAKAQLRFSAVRRKIDGKWQIVSLREFADDPPPTPHERLQELAWLVGDWINEGSDMIVKINYRWSDDGNFLLGEYVMTGKDKPARKSTQRIGWDPQANKLHSWLFDSDGGFSESQWTKVDDDWVLKSTSVNPDGQAATATLTLDIRDKDHFTLKGTDRIVGDSKEPDFELTVSRSPPAPKK